MTKLSTEERKAIQCAIDLNKLDAHSKSVLENLLSTKTEKNSTIDLYVDGAADLHSKTAGIGGVIYRNGDEIFTFAKPLFNKTNNESEYSSMIHGVKAALDINLTSINIYSDSELIVKQVNGEYKIKNDRMLALNQKLHTYLSQLESWTVTHVRREKNKRADALSKEGMAEAKKMHK